MRKQIHPRQKQKILEQHNFTCCSCGATDNFKALEIDHIISIKDGGDNETNNLQVLCYECNMEKRWSKLGKYKENKSPREVLKLIKDKIEEYKDLTWYEFKIIFTQEPIFKISKVGLMDIYDLFLDIKGIKRKGNKKSYDKNNLIIIIKEMITNNLKIDKPISISMLSKLTKVPPTTLGSYKRGILLKQNKTTKDL